MTLPANLDNRPVEQSVILVAGMRHMADEAIAGGRGHMLDAVFFQSFPDIGMAVEAQLPDRLDQHFFIRRTMGLVAAVALSFSHRVMDPFRIVLDNV